MNTTAQAQVKKEQWISCENLCRRKLSENGKIIAAVKLRKGMREKIAENAIRYRIPMEVKQIVKFPDGNSYPVCPHCKYTVERECMRFCDRCGQKLGWNKLKNALVISPLGGLAK